LTAAAALTGAAAATGAAVGGRALPALGAHDPTTRRPTPDRPPPADDLATYEEVILAFRNHGFHLEMFREPITPLGSHYLLIHFDIPKLSATNYSITVGGRVQTPLTLTLESLKARPNVKQPSIMECAGTGRSYAHPRAIYVPWFNEPIGCYEYTGTPLAPILQQAGLLEDAVEVVFTGHDNGVDLGTRHNFERALPIDEAMRDGVILAWDANGQPLLPAHGFPLRLVVPEWYGMASVKWLKSITVIDHPYAGVEQKQVYRLQTSPSDGGRAVQRKSVRSGMMPPGFPDAISRYRMTDRGSQVLQGMAWSGNGAITKVEVSTDDRKTWSPAALGTPVGPHAWTPWTFTWNAAPGEHILSSRATDAANNTQPLEPYWNVQGMAQNAVERIAVLVL
jgi:DMSO/TMAO reductase YedYZ molybdopterin-dependent catalytic subunit